MSWAGRALLVGAVLAGPLGCAARGGDGQPAVAPGEGEAVAEAAAAPAPPIVRVRDFPSTTVVVAWAEEEPFYGLRAEVALDGELRGGVRRGDHRLYLEPNYARNQGGFVHVVSPPGVALRRDGGQSDLYSCYSGEPCSPMSFDGISLPDELLRSNQDSLMVTFHPAVGRNWTITLPRDLIGAYLTAVDSVVAQRRRTPASAG